MEEIQKEVIQDDVLDSVAGGLPTTEVAVILAFWDKSLS